MNELSPELLTAQLNTLLKAYSEASNEANIENPLNIGSESVSISGDIVNSLSTLGSLTDINKLTSMTQFPTTWSGIIDMLPQTGIFSMESMIWSTVWTFVGLWLLWYSKERAKAKIRAKAFHKQAKKFIKEYREEELEHQKEMKRAVANIIADLPPDIQNINPINGDATTNTMDLT